MRETGLVAVAGGPVSSSVVALWVIGYDATIQTRSAAFVHDICTEVASSAYDSSNRPIGVYNVHVSDLRDTASESCAVQ